MPLFKRQEKVLIPPVSAPATRGNPSPRQGHADTYVRSRDGDVYNFPGNKSAVSTPGDANALRDKYNRSNGVGDAYSRGGDLDNDRRELFSGYNPQASKPNQFAGGLGDSEGNDEDIEGIKSQTRFIKQESVNTSRNALRLAREAEDVARNTLSKLGDQSGKMDGFSMILPCLTVH